MSLQTLREEAGLSQRQLAERIGVSQPTITNWEKGVHGVSDENVRKLAEALELDASLVRESLKRSAEKEAVFDRAWYDAVMRDQEISLELKAIIGAIGTFYDERMGVAAFMLEQLAEVVQMEEEDLEAVWPQVLESGHVEREKKVRWILRATRKHVR